MLKSWIVAIALSIAVVGAAPLCSGLSSSHKIDCQSPLDVVSALKPIDKAVTVNKSLQCAAVY